MHKSKLIFTTVFTIIFGAAVNLQAADRPIIRDGEIDGGARILTVFCPSGQRTTVRLYVENFKQYTDGQTCIYRTDGTDICRANWDHDEAAIEACNQ